MLPTSWSPRARRATRLAVVVVVIAACVLWSRRPVEVSAARRSVHLARRQACLAILDEVSPYVEGELRRPVCERNRAWDIGIPSLMHTCGVTPSSDSVHILDSGYPEVWRRYREAWRRAYLSGARTFEFRPPPWDRARHHSSSLCWSLYHPKLGLRSEDGSLEPSARTWVPQ